MGNKAKTVDIQSDDLDVDIETKYETLAADSQDFSLAKIEREYKASVSVNDIWVDPNHNYRKTFPEDVMKALAAGIRKEGLIQPIVLIHTPDATEGKYLLCAGERRFRAIRDFLEYAAVPGAMVWAAEAIKFKRTIAIAENDQREAVPLSERIFGYQLTLQEEYSHWPGQMERIKKFAENTGISERSVRLCISINSITESHQEIKELIEGDYVSDLAAIEHIGKALVEANTDLRKKKVIELIENIKNDNVLGSIRTQAKKVLEYAKKGGRQPEIPTKNSKPSEPMGANDNTKAAKSAPAKVNLSLKNLEVFGEKIESMTNTVDDKWIEQAKTVITALNRKISELEKPKTSEQVEEISN